MQVLRGPYLVNCSTARCHGKACAALRATPGWRRICHNVFNMQSLIRLRLLSVLMVSIALVPAGAGAAWFCEGRQCGVTLLYCCCNDPSGSRDERCADADAPTNGTGMCSAECGCVMTASAQDSSAARVASRTDVGTVDVLVPHVFTFAQFALVATPILHVETRGPPCKSLSVLPLGLRAPPLA